jgi:hypothetical protein
MAQQDQPWWLEAGLEVCESCGQRYAREMERRCEHCDASLCWFCALKLESGEIVCRECTS